jgi:AbrB family looped-hinge helix DNA binding protein
MPLVKVKPKFQVTIPTEVREAAQIAVGDILEATVQGTTIVLTPKAVVDRHEAWEKIERATASVTVRGRHRKQSPKEEEEWIARQVKAHRKQHAKRSV